MTPVGHAPARPLPDLRDRAASALLRTGLLLAVGAGVLLAVPSLATPEEAARTTAADAPRTPAPSERAAVDLLRRASLVARQTSWTGTQLLSTFGAAASSAVVDVSHRAFEGSRMQVRGTAGSPAHQLVQADTTDLTGASPLAAPTAAANQGVRWAGLVSSNYQVALAGEDEVAGERVQVVELRRPDGTPAARIAVGTRSGLPLQRQVFDLRGALVRDSVFTKVATVPAESVAHVEAAATAAAAGAVLSPAELAGLPAQGWTVVNPLVPGLVLVDARRYGAGEDATLHLTYSDGLTAVSLFQQRGRLDTAGLADWRVERRGGAAVLVRRGTPEQLAWTDRGVVLTLVADGTDELVDAAVARLPHPAAAGGFTHRLVRGLARIESWVDPLR